MSEAAPVLHVEAAGMFTTIQDLGRPGRRAAGVPPGGAMDRFLSEGDRLAFTGRRWGARVYVAGAGGLAADRWLGSAATYLLVGRGGVHGRPLKAGDELVPAGPPPRPLVAGRCMPEPLRPAYRSEPELGAIAGPHHRFLSPASRRQLFAERWKVSRDADRMGYRLEGEPLAIKGDELVSFGLAMGCVQVPPAGQPILLMADHQTAGGYPVVAGVGRADLPLAAQVLPGQRVRFRETTVEAAQTDWRALRASLEALKR